MNNENRSLELRKIKTIYNLEWRMIIIILVILAIYVVYSNVNPNKNNLPKCENTKQGEFIVDSNGRICHWKALNSSQCCPSSIHNQDVCYSNDNCIIEASEEHKEFCCLNYNNCVYCCIIKRRESYSKKWKLFSKKNNEIFKECSEGCRTSSRSIVGNKYKSEFKYCSILTFK
eukprot:TRINITY_DN7223_c0_g1_i1.p1 TRINITY_DN7223_c0_g1~~TRINITY_DN7223_c0_g1_i1.p1  ORF type:complete len:173 (-),score=16.42 TRINITY_DN7223_c0_g1_i1:61-579(-)